MLSRRSLMGSLLALPFWKWGPSMTTESDIAQLRQELADLREEQRKLKTDNENLFSKYISLLQVDGIEIGADFFRGQQGFFQLKSATSGTQLAAIYVVPELSDGLPDYPYARIGGYAASATDMFTSLQAWGTASRFSIVTATIDPTRSNKPVSSMWVSYDGKVSSLSVQPDFVQVQQPIWLYSDSVDPTASLEDSFFFYRNDTDNFRGRVNGTWKNFLMEGDVVGQTVVVKAADETVNNSTTLQNDDDLFFAVAANTNYQFEGILVHDSGTTPDIKFQWTTPSGAVGYWAYEPTGNYSNPTSVGLDAGQGELNVEVVEASSGNVTAIRFWGAIANGANAGNCQLQWAQNTADASNTIVHAGSYLKYQVEG